MSEMDTDSAAARSGVVADILDAALSYANYRNAPTSDCEAIFAWNRAIEKLSPALLVELCEIWLMVKAEDIDDAMRRDEVAA